VILPGVQLQRESLSRAALNQRFPFFGGIDQAQLGKRLSAPNSYRCETPTIRCTFPVGWAADSARARVAHQHLEGRALFKNGGPGSPEETEQAAHCFGWDEALGFPYRQLALSVSDDR
jgi:hypothetical protein